MRRGYHPPATQLPVGAKGFPGLNPSLPSMSLRLRLLSVWLRRARLSLRPLSLLLRRVSTALRLLRFRLSLPRTRLRLLSLVLRPASFLLRPLRFRLRRVRLRLRSPRKLFKPLRRRLGGVKSPLSLARNRPWERRHSCRLKPVQSAATGMSPLRGSWSQLADREPLKLPRSRPAKASTTAAIPRTVPQGRHSCLPLLGTFESPERTTGWKAQITSRIG